MSDLIAAVVNGMAQSRNANNAARAAGIPRARFVLTRKLLILKARQILSDKEEETVNQALEFLARKKFKPAEKLSESVILRHWPTRTHHGELRTGKLKTENDKRHKRFAKAIFTISEVCDYGIVESLDIPKDLTRDERKETIQVLVDSMESLSKLITNIRGEYND